MTINIAKEYSKTPGGRYIAEGPYSGEDFRQKMLEPIYTKIKETDEELTVILDGGYGYGSSFLEEAFGGLVRKYLDSSILKKIKIVSDEEPRLVEDVRRYLEEALHEKESEKK